MTLAELRAEFVARGFDFTVVSGSNTRVDRWLNRAYLRLCDMYPWPFLETTTTGTAPLTISDLGQVLSVVDTTNDNILHGRSRRDIVDIDPDLADSGTASYFWLENNVLKVWPADTTSTLSVRYAKVPVDLAAVGDTPILPARYHYLIVDLAVSYGYRDSDNLEAADSAQAQVDREIAEMVHALLHRNYANEELIASTRSVWDWNA